MDPRGLSEAELLEAAAGLLSEAQELDKAREAAGERANLLGTEWRNAVVAWMRDEAANAGVNTGYADGP